MNTGVFPVPRATLIARELRCQGITLETWAKQRSLSLEYVEDVLNGETKDDGYVESEMAGTIGVSVHSLPRAAVA